MPVLYDGGAHTGQMPTLTREHSTDERDGDARAEGNGTGERARLRSPRVEGGLRTPGGGGGGRAQPLLWGPAEQGKRAEEGVASRELGLGGTTAGGAT